MSLWIYPNFSSWNSDVLFDLNTSVLNLKFPLPNKPQDCDEMNKKKKKLSWIISSSLFPCLALTEREHRRAFLTADCFPMCAPAVYVRLKPVFRARNTKEGIPVNGNKSDYKRQGWYRGTLEQLLTSQKAVITFPFIFCFLALSQSLITYLGENLIDTANWQTLWELQRRASRSWLDNWEKYSSAPSQVFVGGFRRGCGIYLFRLVIRIK